MVRPALDATSTSGKFCGTPFQCHKINFCPWRRGATLVDLAGHMVLAAKAGDFPRLHHSGVPWWTRTIEWDQGTLQRVCPSIKWEPSSSTITPGTSVKSVEVLWSPSDEFPTEISCEFSTSPVPCIGSYVEGCWIQKCSKWLSAQWARCNRGPNAGWCMLSSGSCKSM